MIGHCCAQLTGSTTVVAPLSPTSRASFARLGPHKGGGSGESARASDPHFSVNPVTRTSPSGICL
jgi:hypothetical protein